MTPIEWDRFVRQWIQRKEESDKALIVSSYMTARLSRAANMPTLESLLTPPVRAVELSDDEVKRQQNMMDVLAGKIDLLKERTSKRPKRKRRG
jgi:hypothetical protein